MNPIYQKRMNLMYPRRLPFGYKRVNGKILPISDQVEYAIKKFFTIIIKEKPEIEEYKHIAYSCGLYAIWLETHKFTEPDNRAFIRMICNPFYAGFFIFKHNLYKGEFCRIVSPETYFLALEMTAAQCRAHMATHGANKTDSEILERAQFMEKLSWMLLDELKTETVYDETAK